MANQEWELNGFRMKKAAEATRQKQRAVKVIGKAMAKKPTAAVEAAKGRSKSPPKKKALEEKIVRAKKDTIEPITVIEPVVAENDNNKPPVAKPTKAVRIDDEVQIRRIETRSEGRSKKIKKTKKKTKKKSHSKMGLSGEGKDNQAVGK